MHDFMNKDITRDFIRSKRPCAAGYRWYLKREETLSGYQRLLDDLVQEGRVDDACWLLDQLGPTDDVLTLDGLHADALVFAGSVVCHGPLEVGTVIRTGGSLTAAGGVRAGTLLQVGGDVHVEGALQCGGAAGWGVTCGWNGRCAWLARSRPVAMCAWAGRPTGAAWPRCRGRSRSGRIWSRLPMSPAAVASRSAATCGWPVRWRWRRAITDCP